VAPWASPWGSIGITDNDWFACVNLLKQVWPKAQGLRFKAIKSIWANEIRDVVDPGYIKSMTR